jgi:hypothetical protein
MRESLAMGHLPLLSQNRDKRSKPPNRVGQNGVLGGRAGILALSDIWNFAKAVRKVEFKLLHLMSSC